MEISDFQALIWQKERELYRDMPWRDDINPYYVLVSELMLQQTQVSRVIPKFNAFIQAFPDVWALSRASLADVLTVWSGLGYNRRAKFLHMSARRIVSDYGGLVPDTYDDLLSLPGVGSNTAGAILAYAFNQPTIFVETNIRTVYFHYFFKDRQDVTDAELRQAVGTTLDSEHPRQWYQALMDYGDYLKKTEGGRLDVSKHYKKQSPLKGSVREVRGQIIRVLADKSQTESALKKLLTADKRFKPALDSLIREGLVQQTGRKFHLTK